VDGGRTNDEGHRVREELSASEGVWPHRTIRR
jgi:hypothetical protein